MCREFSPPRRALVVGGSTGIGRGIAEAWAGAGWATLIMSRSAPVGPVADGLSWLPLDLARPEPARSQLAAATAASPLEAVCFSAVHYGARRAPVGEVAESEWRRQLEVNLHGLWLTLTATLPALRLAAPGLFVHVSSEVVYNGGPGRSGYAATKAGGSALLASVAQEERDDTVRIVQVLPDGMVDSPGIRRRRSADFDFSSYMRPDAFAPLARELIHQRGAGRHGECLVVRADGGWESTRQRVPVSQSRQLTP